ncbi:MAG: hypothetical protein AAGE03_11275 [Pseudomonadota bacterium]
MDFNQAIDPKRRGLHDYISPSGRYASTDPWAGGIALVATDDGHLTFVDGAIPDKSDHLDHLPDGTFWSVSRPRDMGEPGLIRRLAPAGPTSRIA